MIENVEVYYTENGDTWDLIAYKLFKDEYKFHELMRANPELVEIAIFDSGVPIIIPLIENKKKNESIPPWRR